MAMKDGRSGAGRQELTPEQRFQAFEEALEEALAKLAECCEDDATEGPWSAFREALEGVSAAAQDVRGRYLFILHHFTEGFPIAGFRNPELGVMYGVAVTGGRIPDLREGLERLLELVRDGGGIPLVRTIATTRRSRPFDSVLHQGIAEDTFLDDRWLAIIEEVAVGESTAPLERAALLERAVLLVGGAISTGRLVLRDPGPSGRGVLVMALADHGWAFPEATLERAETEGWLEATGVAPAETQGAGAEGGVTEVEAQGCKGRREAEIPAAGGVLCRGQQEPLTVTEAGQIMERRLGVPLNTAKKRVSGACGRGTLEHTGKGHERRIPVGSFEAWLEKQPGPQESNRYDPLNID